MGMFITAELLRNKGACEDTVSRFLRFYPDGVQVTVAECQLHVDDFSWGWAIEELLTWEEREQANNRAQQTEREINQGIAQRRDAHRDNLRTIREPFAAHLDAHQGVRDQSARFYDRVYITASDGLEKARRETADTYNTAVSEAERVLAEAQKAYRATLQAARDRKNHALQQAEGVYQTLVGAAEKETQAAREQADAQYGESIKAHRDAVNEATRVLNTELEPLCQARNAAWAEAFGTVAGQVTDRWQPPAPTQDAESESAESETATVSD